MTVFDGAQGSFYVLSVKSRDKSFYQKIFQQIFFLVMATLFLRKMMAGSQPVNFVAWKNIKR